MARDLYDGESIRVWTMTHAAALTSTSLSLIGEFYVFYKTYKLSRQRKLDLSHKLPAVISLCDFIFNFHHGVDHLYSIVNNRVASGAMCTWLGFGSLVGLEATALWSLILAAYMSSLVVFGLRLGFDRCFWALGLFGWGLPVIANTIAAAFNQIGDAGMFCMVNGPVSAVIMKPGLFLTVFFFIALCYIAIGIKLSWHVYHHCRTLSSTEGGSDTHDFRSGFRASISHRAQRVGLHLFGFTVVYMLQFLPVCIMVFTIASGKKPGHVLNIFDKVLANGNGWMNAIAFRHFLKTSKQTTSTTIQTTEMGKETAFEMGYPENSSMCKGQIEVTVSRHIILDLPDSKEDRDDPQTPK